MMVKVLCWASKKAETLKKEVTENKNRTLTEPDPADMARHAAIVIVVAISQSL